MPALSRLSYTPAQMGFGRLVPQAILAAPPAAVNDRLPAAADDGTGNPLPAAVGDRG